MPFIFLKKMKFWPFGGGELEMKIEQAQKTENVVPLALSLSCSMKTRVPVSTISERVLGLNFAISRPMAWIIVLFRKLLLYFPNDKAIVIEYLSLIQGLLRPWNWKGQVVRPTRLETNRIP